MLGFTRAEVSALLLGELALEIALALPLGHAARLGLSCALIARLLHTTSSSFPVVIRPRTYAWAALAIVAAGARQRAGRAPAASTASTWSRH